MTNPKDSYRCSFYINQNLQTRPYVEDENAAAEKFNEFLQDRNYGKGIRIFRFDIYVEPEINFGHHIDIVYTGCAQLSAHIDRDKFVSAHSDLRLKFLLNAGLILCKYLAEKVPLPRDFNAPSLIQDYAKFLKQNSLLLAEETCSEAIIKPFETTKFNFIISTTAEVNNKEIHYDLNKIQDFLNNQLSGKTYGKSVRQFDFGYEISNFQGYIKPWKATANLKRYGTKYKRILVVKQFDYGHLKGKTHLEQFNILKSRIIEAINDIDKLNRKPKDFDVVAFRSIVDNLLSQYSDKYCH